MLLQYIIPLLLIFLAFQSINREKQSGRLKLLLLQGANATKLTFAKSLAQAGKTVYSPMAQIRNFVSAGMFYTANGHSFGGSSAEWKKTYQTVMSELGARGVTQTGKITFDSTKSIR